MTASKSFILNDTFNECFIDDTLFIDYSFINFPFHPITLSIDGEYMRDELNISFLTNIINVNICDMHSNIILPKNIKNLLIEYKLRASNSETLYNINISHLEQLNSLIIKNCSLTPYFFNNFNNLHNLNYFKYHVHSFGPIFFKQFPPNLKTLDLKGCLLSYNDLLCINTNIQIIKLKNCCYSNNYIDYYNENEKKEIIFFYNIFNFLNLITQLHIQFTNITNLKITFTRDYYDDYKIDNDLKMDNINNLTNIKTSFYGKMKKNGKNFKEFIQLLPHINCTSLIFYNSIITPNKFLSLTPSIQKLKFVNCYINSFNITFNLNNIITLCLDTCFYQSLNFINILKNLQYLTFKNITFIDTELSVNIQLLKLIFDNCNINFNIFTLFTNVEEIKISKCTCINFSKWPTNLKILKVYGNYYNNFFYNLPLSLEIFYSNSSIITNQLFTYLPNNIYDLTLYIPDLDLKLLNILHLKKLSLYNSKYLNFSYLSNNISQLYLYNCILNTDTLTKLSDNIQYLYIYIRFNKYSINIKGTSIKTIKNKMKKYFKYFYHEKN